MESNDNPEIPDRGETSDTPSFPFGVKIHKTSFDTNVKQNIETSHTHFEEIVNQILLLLKKIFKKKHTMLAHAGIVHPSV